MPPARERWNPIGQHTIGQHSIDVWARLDKIGCAGPNDQADLRLRIGPPQFAQEGPGHDDVAKGIWPYDEDTSNLLSICSDMDGHYSTEAHESPDPDSAYRWRCKRGNRSREKLRHLPSSGRSTDSNHHNSAAVRGPHVLAVVTWEAVTSQRESVRAGAVPSHDTVKVGDLLNVPGERR